MLGQGRPPRTGKVVDKGFSIEGVTHIGESVRQKIGRMNGGGPGRRNQIIREIVYAIVYATVSGIVCAAVGEDACAPSHLSGHAEWRLHVQHEPFAPLKSHSNAVPHSTEGRLNRKGE